MCSEQAGGCFGMDGARRSPPTSRSLSAEITFPQLLKAYRVHSFSGCTPLCRWVEGQRGPGRDASPRHPPTRPQRASLARPPGIARADGCYLGGQMRQPSTNLQSGVGTALCCRVRSGADTAAQRRSYIRRFFGQAFSLPPRRALPRAPRAPRLLRRRRRQRSLPRPSA